MENIEIRKAVSADIPSVLKLYAQRDIDDGNVLSVDEANRILHRFSSYPDYSLYVVTSDEAVVGTFALLIMDNLAHCGKPSGIMEDVVVDSGLQSLGIGRKMVAYAIAACRERGCYKLSLSSSAHRHRAHSFYEKLGFERHGYSFVVEL
jgi:GNAT superfamily N-acetyltransferase